MIELVVRPDFEIRMYKGFLKQWDGERFSDHFEIVSPMALHAFIGAKGRAGVAGQWPEFHSEAPKPKQKNAFDTWLDTVKPLK